MHISLSPIEHHLALKVLKRGDVLTINGVEYDFSAVPDGATLPADAIDCQFIVGDVDRRAGEIHITLLAPHGPRAGEAARFPAPIINPPDGALELPQ